MAAALTMDERQKRQKARNRALLAILLAVVVLFYFLAWVRVGGQAP
jgi:hypothetical protein